MDYKSRFNSIFVDFVSDLIKIFPNDSDLHMCLTAVNTLLVLDDSMLNNMFHKHVATMREYILKKDEQFFLNKDYKEMYTQDEEYYSSMINKLKNYWTKLEDYNKESVWKYFSVLIMLDDKIHNL